MRKASRLGFEVLERRDCPTVAYSFYDGLGGTLLSGNTLGAGITLQSTTGDSTGDVQIDGSDTGVPISSVGSASLVGSGGANYLQLDDAARTWIVSAVNAGSVGTFYPVAFAGITSLVGGTGNDTFAFTGNSSSLAGTLSCAGVGTLDYAGCTRGVTVNLATGMASDTGGISGINNVTGTSGNDILTGNSNSVLDGGAGGNDILIGGSGVNILKSHGNRDILIAGTGHAIFSPGSTGGDLIIGGHSTYDGNLTALNSMLYEWSSSQSYSLRIGYLTGQYSGGFNGSYYLNASTVSTTAGNSLLGGVDGNAGQNWFVVSSIDFNYFVSHRKSGETVTQMA